MKLCFRASMPLSPKWTIHSVFGHVINLRWIVPKYWNGWKVSVTISANSHSLNNTSCSNNFRWFPSRLRFCRIFKASQRKIEKEICIVLNSWLRLFNTITSLRYIVDWSFRPMFDWAEQSYDPYDFSVLHRILCLTSRLPRVTTVYGLHQLTTDHVATRTTQQPNPGLLDNMWMSAFKNMCMIHIRFRPVAANFVCDFCLISKFLFTKRLHCVIKITDKLYNFSRLRYSAIWAPEVPVSWTLLVSLRYMA